MRNTTFISSMVLSVACVSAANAEVTPPGFVGIDDFSLVTQAGGAAGSDGANTNWAYGYVTPFSGVCDLQVTSGNHSFTSPPLREPMAWGKTVTGSGFMTMSYGASVAANRAWRNSPNSGSIYGSYANGALGYVAPVAYEANQAAQTAQSVFSDSSGYALDWSSGTAFSFDISGYSIAGVNNTAVLSLIATDWNYNTFAKTITLTNGHVDLAFSDFTGVDFSNLYWVGFQFQNTDTTSIAAPGVGNTIAVPSGTVSISNFGYVPAPGAIALLGAAGLIGARRRRA